MPRLENIWLTLTADCHNPTLLFVPLNIFFSWYIFSRSRSEEGPGARGEYFEDNSNDYGEKNEHFQQKWFLFEAPVSAQNAYFRLMFSNYSPCLLTAQSTLASQSHWLVRELYMSPLWHVLRRAVPPAHV